MANKILKTLTLPNAQGEPVTYELHPEWDNIENKPDFDELGGGVGQEYLVDGVAKGEIFNDYGSNIASGEFSHAEGYKTTASGVASHVEGYYTDAASDYQSVSGKYNVKDDASKYAEIVGNGESDSKRSNARTLDWDGNAEYAGDVKVQNGLGRVGKGVDGEILLESKDASGDNVRRLILRNPSAKDDNAASLILHVKKNGGSFTGYTLYGTHNQPTPDAIGAAPATHTHDDRYYTESEIDNKFIDTISKAYGVQMVGDITDVDTLTKTYQNNSIIFRTLGSDLGILPSTYASYAKLRSSRDGNYTIWICTNGAKMWYAQTGDGNNPTAASWKEIATISDIPEIDDGLTVSGAAADAKAVGDALQNKVNVVEGSRLMTAEEANKLAKLVIDEDGNAMFAGTYIMVGGQTLTAETIAMLNGLKVSEGVAF